MGKQHPVNCNQKKKERENKMRTWHLSQHVHSGNFAYALWTAACAFLAPIGWWLAGCAFFVLADFITGCWASRKRGEMWTSARFRDSLSKCTAYMFMIICARILESILPSYIEGAEISRLFAGFICGTEMYSVIENMYKATGNRVFYILTQFTNKKLEEITGHKAKEE